MKIKALTLWQPWASLIALGHKTIETRGWDARYKGLLAIHAASKWEHTDRQSWDQADQSLRDLGLTPALPVLVPHGCIVALAHLDRCEQVINTARYAPQEILFGDLRTGRWAWLLSNVQPLTEPVDVPGRQGLWDLPGTLNDLVLARLPRRTS